MFEDRIEAREDMLDFERKMAAVTRRRGTRIKVMKSEDRIQKKGSSSTVLTLYRALSVGHTLCRGDALLNVLGLHQVHKAEPRVSVIPGPTSTAPGFRADQRPPTSLNKLHSAQP